MLTSGPRNPEAAGFLLSLTFVGLASVRDVYLGGLVQRVSPLLVAVTAFTLCTLVFLAVALVRDRAGLARLVEHRGRLVWVNATTALAWLSFFFALRAAEPALVQILFFGVGPLSVAWLDGRLMGSAPTGLTSTERRLQAGLLGCLLLAVLIVLGGFSGLDAGRPARAVVGIFLALAGGTSIAVSSLLCRTLNDAGVRPATLMGLRFPGAVLLAGLLIPLSGDDPLAAVTPAGLAGVGLASLLLIVLPSYVNQIGVALASPVTVRAVLALGPVLVFFLQLLEGRVSSSRATLTACVLYALVTIAGAVARRRTVARVTAGRAAPPASSRCPC
jgi:drug/metabolite transporter (DMT)-like permease